MSQLIYQRVRLCANLLESDLARLWQQPGKQTEDHHLLSKIYSWFTEGFDIKDLHDAKVWLNELVEEHCWTRSKDADGISTSIRSGWGWRW